MEHLLSIAEVAETLGVPEASLRYWRHLGTGPPSIKIGRHVRYRPADVDKWLEANTSRAAS
jgi:excisionase family DNA binding protein